MTDRHGRLTQWFPFFHFTKQRPWPQTFNSTTLHDMIYCQKQMLDISSHPWLPFQPQKVAIHSLPLYKVNVFILTSSIHWHVQAHAEREREREVSSCAGFQALHHCKESRTKSCFIRSLPFTLYPTFAHACTNIWRKSKLNSLLKSIATHIIFCLCTEINTINSIVASTNWWRGERKEISVI